MKEHFIVTHHVIMVHICCNVGIFVFKWLWNVVTCTKG